MPRKPEQTAHLDNWQRVHDILVGTVSGHPHIPDGEMIRTSRIRALDTRRGQAITLNTRYTLGAPHPDSIEQKR